MRNYLTTNEKCTGTISIFAIPNRDYDPDADEGHPESIPFYYEFKDGTWHYRDDAILVYQYELTWDVPAGINLVQMAIETLNKKKEKAREDYMDTCKRMDDLISNLTLITYSPGIDEVIPHE